MRRLNFLVLMFGCFCGVFSKIAWADTKVVDPTGRGDYLTIQAAVDDLPDPGPRTIIVRAGIYQESVRIDRKNEAATKEAHRIFIMADPSAPVGSVVISLIHLKGKDKKHAFVLEESKFITIMGFRVTGASQEAILLKGRKKKVNCEITLANNDISASGEKDKVSAVVIGKNNARVLFINNAVHHNPHDGVMIEQGSERNSPVYLVNNTLIFNGGDGVDIGAGEKVFLVNNLVVSNGSKHKKKVVGFGINREAVKGSGAPAFITLLNNIFYRNIAGDIANPAQTLDATDQNNLTTTGAEGMGVVGSIFPDATDRTPLTAIFVDAANGDFHIVESSPAIDAGVNRFVDVGEEFIISQDFEGEVRPLDGDGDGVELVDVGWDEREIPNPDRDHDGLLDAWERQYFGNLDQGPDGDFDGDGLSNLGELQAGTDPTNPDTDGDTVKDGIEILQGRSPLKGAITGGSAVNLKVYTLLE